MTQHFFGLNSKFRDLFLQEIESCMRYMNMQYSEVMNMPTCTRRSFINIRIKSNEREREKTEERKSTGGKGSRVKKVSGDAVKKYSGMI